MAGTSKWDWSRALQLQDEGDIFSSVAECGRSRKVYSRKSWEVLGEPIPCVWRWIREGIIKAQLDPPSVMGPAPTSSAQEPAVAAAEEKEDGDM